MTHRGRLPCVNPACKRTAAAGEFGDSEIICAKCWKLLPQPVKARFKQLRRREKRLLRLIEHRVHAGDIRRETVLMLESRITAAFAANWQVIRDYFQKPETPVGLEGFLQEVGL